MHEGPQLHGQLKARRVPQVPDVIDVEASGFGRGSYPIEVGVALASGRTACFLIRPFPDWIHWTDEAESLHRISRAVLETYGRPPTEVAAGLNTLLDGRTVYSDAWGVDSSWLALLHERVGLPATYRVDALNGLLTDGQRDAWARLKQHARLEMGLTRHRASADALVLQRAFTASRAA